MATAPSQSPSSLVGLSSGPVDVVSRLADPQWPNKAPLHPEHERLLSSINTDKDGIYLWANSQSGIALVPQSEPSDYEGWGRQSGYVRIVSTTRRQIKGLSVKFVARQSLAFPQDKGRTEDDEIVGREATCREESPGGLWLDKGINVFEFILRIPPTFCMLVVDNGATKLTHHVIATAVGSAQGLFGKDLVVESRVYAMAVPADPEDLIFRHHSADFHPDLGPVSLEVSSHLFVVAGAVFISLVIASPPPTLRVYAFKAFLEQTTNSISLRDPSKTSSLVQKIPLLEAGFAGPYTNQALRQLQADGKVAEAILFDASRTGQDGFTLEEMTRMPLDYALPDDKRTLRASTYPETNTCVRISSKLIVDIYFTNASTGSKNAPRLLIAQILNKPVFLNSCGCIPGRLSLPEWAPTPERFQPLDVRVPCLCDEPTKQVLEAEWKYLRASRAAAAAGQSPGEESEAALDGRKVGEIRRT